ncbi:MAG: UxaA family hydrolase [Clostridiales bacterium]|nr:UxaA family hydrolase [Clostridiales bacterium]
MYNSLVIKEGDTVTTVIAAIKAGEKIIYDINGEEKSLTACTDIPIYHKAALKDIKKGDVVIKYGCKIGYALQDIKEGEHVHTWNLDSSMK